MMLSHSARFSTRHKLGWFLRLLFILGCVVEISLATAATPISLTTPVGFPDYDTVVAGTKIVFDDQLLYLDRPVTNGPMELYIRGINGSDTPRKFDIPLDPMWNVDGYYLTGDSQRLLVRTRRGYGDSAYFWANLDDPINVVPAGIEFPVTPHGDIEQLSVSGSDGILRVRNAPVEELGLASVSLDSQSSPVNHFVPGANTILNSYRLSSDGQRIVYWSQQTSAPYTEQLVSSPLDGSSPPVPLDVPSDFTGDYQITADSSRVIYERPQGVFSVDITGAGPAVQLSPPLPTGGAFSNFVTRLDRVFFRSQVMAGVTELFSAPIDGSAPAVKLNGELQANGDVFGLYQFAADYQHVLYCADADVDDRLDLFARRVDGSGELIALGDTTLHGSVVASHVHPSAPLLYWALTPQGDEYALFATNLENPDNVSALGARFPKSELQFNDMRLSEDGQWLVYGANFVNHHYQSVLAVATDGSIGPFEVVSAGFFGDELTGEIERVSVGQVLGDNPRLVFSAYGSSKSAVFSAEFEAPLLPGDFNGDGIVDSADYTTIRDGLGSTHTTTDYIVWKSNFGRSQSAGSAGGSSSHAVPEPSSIPLLACPLIGMARCRRR